MLSDLIQLNCFPNHFTLFFPRHKHKADMVKRKHILMNLPRHCFSMNNSAIRESAPPLDQIAKPLYLILWIDSRNKYQRFILCFGKLCCNSV